MQDLQHHYRTPGDQQIVGMKMGNIIRVCQFALSTTPYGPVDGKTLFWARLIDA